MRMLLGFSCLSANYFGDFTKCSWWGRDQPKASTSSRMPQGPGAVAFCHQVTGWFWWLLRSVFLHQTAHGAPLLAALGNQHRGSWLLHSDCSAWGGGSSTSSIRSLWAACQGLSSVCTPALPLLCQEFNRLMQPVKSLFFVINANVFLVYVCCCCTLDCIQTYFMLCPRAELLGVPVAVLQSRDGCCCHCCSYFFTSLLSPRGHHRAWGDLLTVPAWDFQAHVHKEHWHCADWERPREKASRRGALRCSLA